MDNKTLCLSLMRADTEEQVIGILKEVGYWGDVAVWRLFGDEEGNYSVAGAQQSKADAALVEKIINSVDARLMDEVLKRDVDPQSIEAPQDIRTAVAKYIENHSKPESSQAGRLQFWSDTMRKDISEDVAVVATGNKPKDGNPSFSIVDRGEGQTPDMVPNTLMSLIRGNKAKIPFVQGKFNMGGTGAFRFCGKNNLQLVITKRDPQIVGHKKYSDDDDLWSFTVVRRDNAKEGERSSVYRYLAPISSNSKAGQGGVTRFSSQSMPLFPSKGKPYVIESEWGTLIKLYEYHAQGFRSHILMGDGLLERLNMMLPDPALPVRLHECRDYKGHVGSYENTLTGLSVRLSDDKLQNLEVEPISCPLGISGEKLLCTIYVFKKGRAKSYKKDEGLVFVYNGQTHAKISKYFFKANRVNLGYIANSMMVVIDCSELSRRAFEDLFMNSRDRLSDDAELTKQIKSEVAYMLKNHEGLKELQNKRREEEIASKLDDSKPLEDVLEKIFENSPTLSSLFLKGTRLSSAFKKKKVKKNDEYIGNKFPSFFHFLGKGAGEKIQRECHVNLRCRIQFQTDVENSYFSRIDQPGYFTLELIKNNVATPVTTYVGPNLNNGFATLTFPLPDVCNVGDKYQYRATINDETQVDPFINEFDLNVLKATEVKKSKKNKRKKPPSEEEGIDLEIPGGISLPEAKWVTQEEWEDKDPPFDQRTALRVVQASSDDNDSINGGESATVYDFYINRDNVYLKQEEKGSTEEPRLLEEKFRIGMVLIGLSMIHDEATKRKSKSDDEGYDKDDNYSDVGSRVENITRALAPFLLPMINSLGSIEDAALD